MADVPDLFYKPRGAVPISIRAEGRTLIGRAHVRALPDRCKRSLSRWLNVAMMPLLAPLPSAVMPLLLPLSFVPVTQRNMNVFSGLGRSPVGWTRDSTENSVTGRPILGSARDEGVRMTDLPPLRSAVFAQPV